MRMRDVAGPMIVAKTALDIVSKVPERGRDPLLGLIFGRVQPFSWAEESPRGDVTVSTLRKSAEATCVSLAPCCLRVAAGTAARSRGRWKQLLPPAVGNMCQTSLCKWCVSRDVLPASKRRLDSACDRSGGRPDSTTGADRRRAIWRACELSTIRKTTVEISHARGQWAGGASSLKADQHEAED